MGKKIDLTGKKFGRLTVLKDTGKRNNSKRIVYLCKCDCGNYTEVSANELRNGGTKSCGCLRLEKITKHGLSHSKHYRIWADMIQRCENKKSPNYPYYGARGIKVCDEWHDFRAFDKWAMNNGYVKGLSLDRIDPNGNYEPSNCRWVTREIQDNNTRKTIWVEINGEKMPLSMVARKYNLNYNMLQYRYSIGERGEKLIEKPKRGYKRNGKIFHHKYAKLNKKIVSEVKWLVNHTKLYQYQIAGKYGISQTMVSKLKLGKYHSDVEEKKPDWWNVDEAEN